MRPKRLIICALACFAADAAFAELSVVGSLTYEYTVEAGVTKDGVIELSNTGDKPQEYKVYQTDYSFYADGRVLYGDPGKLPRSNASWITLSPKQGVIPPKQSVRVAFSVRAPDDATLAGTYWSVIMVEPIAEGSAESSAPGGGQPAIGINEVMRYAIQVVTHFGETGKRSVKFAKLRLENEAGLKTLVAEVENTGERMLRGHFWVDLFDANGAHVGKFEGNGRRLYPQTSAAYQADLAGVPNGSYKALVVVDCGGADIFGVNVNLVLKD